MKTKRTIEITEKYNDIKAKMSGKKIGKEINCYICSDCKQVTKTKDIHAGTTPFMIGCPKCNGIARSTFYNDIRPKQQPTHEWYFPNLEEVLNKHLSSPGSVEHYLMGGLEIRKIVILILTLFFSIQAESQISGIPEQDSLLKLKDELYLKNQLSGGIYQLEHDWVRYQWLCWVYGKKEKRCVYECNDWDIGYYVHISECPKLYYGYPANCEIKDTLIHIPKPISWEGFMDFKVKKALQN